MSSNNTVLPPVHRLQPLADWAKQNLAAVITATSDDEFKTAFDQFVSEHVKKIILNDREITRDEYRRRLQKEGVNLIGATINIHDVVEVPKLQKDGEANETAGNVGIFYNAEYRESPLPINPNGPNSNIFTPHGVRSSLNIEVEQDSTVRGPVFEERRRVFKLNQVYLEEPIGIEGASS